MRSGVGGADGDGAGAGGVGGERSRLAGRQAKWVVRRVKCDGSGCMAPSVALLGGVAHMADYRARYLYCTRNLPVSSKGANRLALFVRGGPLFRGDARYPRGVTELIPALTPRTKAAAGSTFRRICDRHNRGVLSNDRLTSLGIAVRGLTRRVLVIAITGAAVVPPLRRLIGPNLLRLRAVRQVPPDFSS